MTKGNIYVITNRLDGKMYVGQTTRAIHKRFAQHVSHAKSPRWAHRDLYIAMNKDGFDNFYIKLLEVCEAPNVAELRDIMLEREVFWAVELNTVHPNGYNHALKGKYSDKYIAGQKASWRNAPHNYYKNYTKEDYREWGRSMANSPNWQHYLNSGKASEHYHKHSEARLKGLIEARGVKVEQRTKDGVFIARYESVAEASRSTGVSVDAIFDYLNGKTKRPRKYTWHAT